MHSLQGGLLLSGNRRGRAGPAQSDPRLGFSPWGPAGLPGAVVGVERKAPKPEAEVSAGVQWEGLSQEVPKPLGFQLQHWLWALLPISGRSLLPMTATHPEPRTAEDWTLSCEKVFFQVSKPIKVLFTDLRPPR